MWECLSADSSINIDCLLPTGLLVILERVQIECVLSEIKKRLWSEASSYPFFSLLKDPSSYVFVCVSRKGKQEELCDETLSLADVKPHQPLLKLIHRRGNREEKLFRSAMSDLVDKNLNDFDDMGSSEVNAFRRQYRQLAETINNDRMRLDWVGRALYAYPPELNCERTSLEESSGRFVVTVLARDTADKCKKHCYNISANNRPSDLVLQDLKKEAIVSGANQENHMFEEQPGDYVMKVVGREAYLLGEHPLMRYKVSTNIIYCICQAHNNNIIGIVSGPAC